MILDCLVIGGFVLGVVLLTAPMILYGYMIQKAKQMGPEPRDSRGIEHGRHENERE